MLHMNLPLIVEVQSIGANVPCATMIAGEGGVAVTAGEEIDAVAVGPHTVFHATTSCNK